MKNNIHSSVLWWYVFNYPGDEMGWDILPHVTFQMVWDALQSGVCVYATMGAGDSVVRERVFARLSEILDVEYEHVYNTWLQL
jgi:hypothetical protein